MPPCADGEGKGAAAAPVCQKARHLASNHGWQSVNRGERGGNSTHAGKKGTGFGAWPRVEKRHAPGGTHFCPHTRDRNSFPLVVAVPCFCCARRSGLAKGRPLPLWLLLAKFPSRVAARS